ncbi:DMT family transporter [Pokkaliibacter plantistimulans]|nr:DMT family transporter [Pokkaliibacter plantistimulans]
MIVRFDVTAGRLAAVGQPQSFYAAGLICRSTKMLSRRFLPTVVLATFLFGSSFPASKALLHDMAPLWLVSLRFLTAALSLLPVVIWQWRRGRLPRAMPWGKLLLIGLLQTTGSMALLNLGLQTTLPATAAILMASNPLWVALLSWLLLRERIQWQVWSGSVLALAGVMLCLGITSLTATLSGGELLVLCGTWSWALATLAIRRFALPLDSWTLSFWQMLMGALALGLLALLSGQSFALPDSLSSWLTFGWLALPATTGAMVTWFMALAMGGAVYASGFLFLTPLFATLIGFALTRHLPAASTLLGGVLIGCGIYWAARRPVRQNTADASAIKSVQ